MKKLFDELSYEVSKCTTKKYSTSFSLGILALKPTIRNGIYAIYGFVRLADEIVDSFHDYDKEKLLNEFKKDTYKAIEAGISLNPILQSFQESVHQYQIDPTLIDQFLHSMEMDLNAVDYNSELYEEYIFGSAEVVGLMCLQVFTQGDKTMYGKLKPYAQKLGSAFQKVNFLRDLQEDYEVLGRTYFPNIEMNVFNDECKVQIEQEIEMEFKEALIGIKMLPDCAKFGVYLAYRYYLSLFRKIRNTHATKIMTERVRIPNTNKLFITMRTYVKYKITSIQ
ncbi:MAG TPA: phytoene/squalene synthase family protein [Flavobacteriaceae bacterium]|nr:phytoene/squalene synthase family protein [Flavobacteriaceae bacterium]